MKAHEFRGQMKTDCVLVFADSVFWCLKVTLRCVTESKEMWMRNFVLLQDLMKCAAI